MALRSALLEGVQLENFIAMLTPLDYREQSEEDSGKNEEAGKFLSHIFHHWGKSNRFPCGLKETIVMLTRLAFTP